MRPAARHVWRKVAVAAWLAAAPCATAEPPATGSFADHVLAATVGISAESADGGASFSGTGSLVSPRGHILTSTSVVPPDATKIEVMLPGFVRKQARLVAADAALAASLIQVDGERLPCLPLARELPTLGELAYTAGDVDRVMLTNGRASFSRGVVSGLYDVAPLGESTYAGRAIETTAAVNPGSDGGPLVDARGRLAGVISLGVSPLRWQGVAVPTAVLLERFVALRSNDVPFTSEPPAGLVPDPVTQAAAGRMADLARAAAALVPHLVAIEVDRRFPPERLPRVAWGEHRGGIAGWDGLGRPERAARFAAFANVDRAFEVNQLLRRPPGPVTGLVVSPDGLVLTSLFNLAADTAFVAKATGKPRAFAADEPIQKLLADPPGGLTAQPNAVTGLTVILADGTRRTGKVIARHEPLGIALVKIEATGLAAFDLAAAGTSPQLGDAVAVVGRPPGGPATHTLNTGIVSAPSRLRGYQFQTDALFNYGNSGGPVVDAAGNFLGIATAPIEPDTVQGRMFPPPQLMRWTRAPNSGVGMVARADRIAAAFGALASGRSFDRIPGPFLGVEPDMSQAFGEDVVIGGVAAGSPAERAGLRKGDRLLEFDGVELQTWRDLTERVAASRAGDTVTLVVQRPSRGPRLVISGRDVETLEDLERLKKSLQPGDTFEGTLTTDDTREIGIVLEERR